MLKGAGGNIAAAVLGTDYTIYNSTSFNTDFATKTTDNLTQGSTNKYSQWTRTIDGSREMIKPSNADDQLVIGPLTDLDALGNIADAKYVLNTSTETTFGGAYAAGPNTFINGGGLFVSMRADGSVNSPTGVSVGMGIGGWVPLAHDGTSFTTNSDGITLPGLYAFAMDVATGDIGQNWEIMGGVAGSTAGVIRLNTQNKIGFHRATPVAQSTGWSVTNLTTNKTLDCNSVTLSELADFVGSLASHLLSRGDLAA